MFDALPSLSHTHLLKFLIILTHLMTSHLQIFAPHLHALLFFLPATFLPTLNGGLINDEELDEAAKEVHKAMLKFMISLSEAKPTMVCCTNG